MFLNMLNEQEKQEYLNLVVLAAHINGVLEDEEKIMIRGYQREMGLTNDAIPVCSELDEASVFRGFSESEVSHKKIVLFELIGLLLCDNEYDEDETRFVIRFCDAAGMPLDEAETISQLAVRYFNVITEIAESIFTV